MNKMLVIARREYLEVLRTKMFWLGVLLPPILLLIGAMLCRGKHIVPTPEVLTIIGGFAYLIVMFMSVTTVSQLLVMSLIEEKSSRVVEVLLSAVSPFELMAGKILGLVAVGLTNAAVFVAALAVFAGSTGLLKAPGVTLLTLFLAYYLLGFVMYACVFASVGAACNTLKDAQAVMMPLTLAMILPLMLAMNVAQHPDGFWAVALSIFPPTAPMFMILRIVVLPAPPWLEIVISLALLAAAAPCMVWAAAKIFRTGVLLYGKAPKLGELLRWVRSS
ncbi:MAG: ABC transporter permease [Candidatus Brocadiia bacterium]|jgi:ABC-2 type transport system permease protein